MQIVTIIYRLAIALWVGGVAIFTFAMTPLIFKTETRDAAGRIVGYLFPTYFRWGAVCGLIALVCLLVVRGKQLVPALALLIVMLTATSFQSFYLEPKAAAIKQQIPSFETTPKDHPLRREFSRIHGISAVCNLVVFAGGVVLVVLF